MRQPTICGQILTRKRTLTCAVGPSYNKVEGLISRSSHDLRSAQNGLAKLRPVTSIERDRDLRYLEIPTLKTLTTFLFTRTKQSSEQRRDGGEPFAPILELLGPV